MIFYMNVLEQTLLCRACATIYVYTIEENGTKGKRFCFLNFFIIKNVLKSNGYNINCLLMPLPSRPAVQALR